MKRYDPDITYTEDRCWGEWITTPSAIMVEMRSGKWTPWQNAHDAVSMYQKRIERLEARLAKTEDELFLLKANSPI